MLPEIFSKEVDLGLCPGPRDLPLCPNPEAGEAMLRITKTGVGKKDTPPSVLGPGSALGSLPSVALSSVQVGLQDSEDHDK